MSIVKKGYDQNYFENAFYKEKLHSQRNKLRLAEILSYKNSGTLLELGCGEGGFLIEASPHFNTRGLDISKYAAQRANDVLNGRVLIGDIEKSDLSSGTLDVIVAFNIFEHLENTPKTIKKCYLGLNNGGILFGSVPNNFGIIGGLSTLLSNVFDKTHCFTYPPDFWHQSFLKSGFSKIRFFGEITLGRNSAIYIKNNLWKFLSFNLIFICTK